MIYVVPVVVFIALTHHGLHFCTIPQGEFALVHQYETISLYLMNQHSFPVDDKLKKLLKRIGSNIRDIRLKNKLSQEALGFKSGISPPLIKQMEEGEADFTLLDIQRVAKALRTTAKTLLS